MLTERVNVRRISTLNNTIVVLLTATNHDPVRLGVLKGLNRGSSAGADQVDSVQPKGAQQ